MSGAIIVDSMSTRIGASVSLRIWCAPSLPRGKADDVSLAQRLFALVSAKRRRAAEHDHPLLVGVMRVIRPEPSPGSSSYMLPPISSASDVMADPGVCAFPALAVLGAIPLVPVEVEDLHTREPRRSVLNH